MNNKVVNKQIPLETIIKVANHLEDYKEKYDKKFELEENKNKNTKFLYFNRYCFILHLIYSSKNKCRQTRSFYNTIFR